MKNILKSEIYKIFSVRSTYYVIILAILAASAFSFIGEGLKYADGVFDSNKFANLVLQSTQLISLLIVVIATLHITNEYRHNTINYTLTISNSRTKVFLAKFISIGLVAAIFTVLMLGVVTLGTYIGLQVANAPDLPHQVFPLSILAKILFHNIGLCFLAVIIALLTRSIAATLGMILIGFNIIEGLLSLLLKSNADYLPMNSLRHVIGVLATGDPDTTLSPLKASAVFSGYIIVSGVITWYVFIHRDAS